MCHNIRGVVLKNALRAELDDHRKQGGKGWDGRSIPMSEVIEKIDLAGKPEALTTFDRVSLAKKRKI